MNSIVNKVLMVVGLILLASCVNNDKIFALLRGKNKEDVIRGARKAGRARDKVFDSELLRNAADQRESTNMNYYGVTVYQAKMEALEQIFGQALLMKLPI